LCARRLQTAEAAIPLGATLGRQLEITFQERATNCQIFSSRSLGSSISQKENGSMISQQTGEASPTISGFSTDRWIQDFRPAKHCSCRYLGVSPANVHPVTERQPDLWVAAAIEVVYQALVTPNM
jgi:hypothetical protein